MKHLLFISAMLFGVCKAQISSTRVLIEERKDTFFVFHQYATKCYFTLPPQYDGYINVQTDTLFRKDSLIIKEWREYEIKKRDAIFNYYKYN